MVEIKWARHLVLVVYDMYNMYLSFSKFNTPEHDLHFPPTPSSQSSSTYSSIVYITDDSTIGIISFFYGCPWASSAKYEVLYHQRFIALWVRLGVYY